MRENLDHDSRLVPVAEAVHTLNLHGVVASVGNIAKKIGTDQSQASRLIQDATKAGYTTKVACATDGRRRTVLLTRCGRGLLLQAHRWQESTFDQWTTGWSDDRRATFRRDLTDLLDRSGAGDA